MSLQSTADLVQSIVTSCAVVVGGGWAYFKFARGRTFANRAEVQVTASLENRSGDLYICAVVTLTNRGLSKVPLNRDFKAVRLYGAMARGDQIAVAWWHRISTDRILKEHDWLEGEETVTDTVLYFLPGCPSGRVPYAAYQVEAVVGVRLRRFTKHIKWQSRSVVFAPAGQSAGGPLPANTYLNGASADHQADTASQ